MNINKIIIYLTTISILLIIGCPTIYKVIKINHENLYKVTDKLLIESAEKCFYEGKCKSNKVTLKELYDNKYLEKDIINPVTKEIYNEKVYIEITKEKSIINY